MEKKDLVYWWLVWIAVITTLLNTFLWDTTNTNDTVIQIEPQVNQNTQRIEKMETDFDNWRTNGELPLDVAQNKDIEYLKNYVWELKVKIEKAEQAIQQILIEQASS